MIFVQVTTKSVIIQDLHNTGVEAVVTDMGDQAKNLTVPIHSGGEFSFDPLVKGDKIKYQYGSESWSFNYNNEHFKVIHPSRIKICCR